MYDRILFPTDGSDGARVAAEDAIRVADEHDATLHVLYVADVRMSPISSKMAPEEALELIDHVGERPTTPIVERADAAGVPAVEAIRVGVPHEQIRAYADEEAIDLIVMGTHGRTGLEHALLGSVTEKVVRQSSIPVLSVPMDGDGDDDANADGDDASDDDADASGKSGD